MDCGAEGQKVQSWDSQKFPHFAFQCGYETTGEQEKQQEHQQQQKQLGFLAYGRRQKLASKKMINFDFADLDS